jgi:hypothetical protein
MTDTRFTTEFEDLGELLAGVDIDGIDDVETLLMILIARPLGLSEGLDHDAASLEVILHGNEASVSRMTSR